MVLLSQVAVPAGTQLPTLDLRPRSGVKGKSAPASFTSTTPKMGGGGPEPWQRGRTPCPNSPSPLKTARCSPRHRPASPLSDTSSGLGTPVETDSDGFSSDAEASAQLPVQPRMCKVSFTESSGSQTSSQIRARPGYMESPFDAAAQLAHVGESPRQGQGPSHVGNGPAPQAAHMVKLPRADVLVIGGDLAYPNPSNETYEQRFFRPFEAALPPPPHVRPGRLVVYKPDLPGAADLRHSEAAAIDGMPQPSSRYSGMHTFMHLFTHTCTYSVIH